MIALLLQQTVAMIYWVLFANRAALSSAGQKQSGEQLSAFSRTLRHAVSYCLRKT